MSCDKRHHECSGTDRIIRVADAAGIKATARHYFTYEYTQADGEVIPGEWVYEARSAANDVKRMRSVAFDPELIEMPDVDITPVLAADLEHLR